MHVLAETTVEQVRVLLREGLSQREAARQARVSRNRVQLIAHGRRPDYAALPARKEDEPLERCGPIERCRKCGMLVEMPCLVCQARVLREAALRRGNLATSDEILPLGVDLRGGARRRYQRIYVRKTEAAQDGFLD